MRSRKFLRERIFVLSYFPQQSHPVCHHGGGNNGRCGIVVAGVCGRFGFVAGQRLPPTAPPPTRLTTNPKLLATISVTTTVATTMRGAGLWWQAFVVDLALLWNRACHKTAPPPTQVSPPTRNFSPPLLPPRWRQQWWRVGLWWQAFVAGLGLLWNRACHKPHHHQPSSPPTRNFSPQSQLPPRWRQQWWCGIVVAGVCGGFGFVVGQRLPQTSPPSTQFTTNPHDCRKIVCQQGLS